MPLKDELAIGQPAPPLRKLLKALHGAAVPDVLTQSVAVLGLEKKEKPPLMLGRKWLGEL